MTRSRRPLSAAEAFEALQNALRRADPACSGDDRFTDENADPTPLSAICAGCAVFTQCEAVAMSSQTPPIWGIIAGRVRRGAAPSTLTRVD